MIYKKFKPIAAFTASAFLEEVVMQHNVKIMMDLLRCSACGEKADEKIISALTPEILQDIYAVAYRHGLIQLVGDILEKSGALGENPTNKRFRKEVLDAVYSFEKLSYETEQISRLFEKNGIPFVLLKGAFLRYLYSEPFLRTSCDVDILIHENDLEKADELLAKSLDYEKTHDGAHHITYLFGDVKIELHFSLIEKYQAKHSYKVAQKVWDFARVKEGYEYQYILDESFVYFYHIAHCATHFEAGGCGIKPVLDLYILKQKFNCETPEIKSLLRRSGLTKFNKFLNELCDVWFMGKEHNEVTKAMENFIIDGGIGGTEEQNLLLKKHRLGGKTGYIISRIFVPSKELKNDYPILKKIPVLLPFFAIFRWFKLLFEKDKNYIARRYETVKNISDEDLKIFGEMFDKTGL